MEVMQCDHLEERGEKYSRKLSQKIQKASQSLDIGVKGHPCQYRWE